MSIRNNFFIITTLSTIIFISFLPVFNNDFVDWDDQMHLMDNPNYRGLSLSNLKWMFTTFKGGHYHPLTWLSFAIDYSLWKMDPFGYHLSNLLLHVANAILLYLLILNILKMVFKIKNSAYLSASLGCLLFAIHPLRVESVAWATERRDVLAGFFYFLTILTYFHMCQRKKERKASTRYFIFSIFFMILSLLSKAWAITIPFLFIILDVYPLKRFNVKKVAALLLEKIPYFVLAISGAILAMIAQVDVDATRTLEQHSVISRIMQAMYGLSFYIYKTISPFNLSPIYELEQTLDPTRFKYILAAVIIFSITSLFIILRKKFPQLFTTWLCYILIVSPTLGFFQSGPQIVADRYSYLALAPFVILISGSIYWLWEKYMQGNLKKSICVLIIVVSIVSVISLGTLTYFQSQIWQNSLTLWLHAAKIEPDSHIALINLASVFEKKGDINKAILCYEQVIYYHPKHPDANFNLGVLYEKQGFINMAIKQYCRVIDINPEDGEAYNNLALLFYKQRYYNKALLCSKKAVKYKNDFISHYNLARTYLQLKKTKLAIFHFQKAFLEHQSPQTIEVFKSLNSSLRKSIIDNMNSCSFNSVLMKKFLLQLK